jgi:hypothetical protein
MPYYLCVASLTLRAAACWYLPACICACQRPTEWPPLPVRVGREDMKELEIEHCRIHKYLEMVRHRSTLRVVDYVLPRIQCPTANCSPHTGHSIRSKSTRRTWAGVISPPHFGHTASSEACTFSRLIFRERGMVRTILTAYNSRRYAK